MPEQVARSAAAGEALRGLACLGGALALLLQLDRLQKARGVAQFLIAAPLLGVEPTPAGLLHQPVGLALRSPVHISPQLLDPPLSHLFKYKKRNSRKQTAGPTS